MARTNARVAKTRNPKPEDVEAILSAVAEGKSLRFVCREMGIHPGYASAMMRSAPDLAAQYARAREERAEVLAESVLTIAQDAMAGGIKPDAARVAIDAYKWAAGKMDAKRYGDKVQAEVSGGFTVNFTSDDAGF
jgi:hypothetical protein